MIRFAYQLDAERKLSGAELSSLAARMTETDDAVEAARIPEGDSSRLLRGEKIECLKSGGKSSAGFVGSMERMG